MRIRPVVAGLAALFAAAEAQSFPLTAAGEFLNIPSASPVTKGATLLQLGGGYFKASRANSGFGELSLGVSHVVRPDIALDLHVLYLPDTPPLSQASGEVGGGAGRGSFGGGALGVRYLRAFTNPKMPRMTLGVEIASNAYASRNTMYWAWWSQSDQFSPFVAFTRPMRLGDARNGVDVTGEIGWGWGRFRGYGPVTGKLFGLFGGASVSRGPVSLVLELDGRDFHGALRYQTGSLRLTLAALQMEHFQKDRFGNKRPVHFTAGAAYSFGSRAGAAPKPGAGRPLWLPPPTNGAVAFENGANGNGYAARISWDAPDPKQAKGVNVYISTFADGPWRKLNKDAVAGATVTLRGVQDPAKFHVSLSTVDVAGEEGPKTAALPRREAAAPPVAPPVVPTVAPRPPTAVPTQVKPPVPTPPVAEAKPPAVKPEAAKPAAPKPPAAKPVEAKPAAPKPAAPKPAAPKPAAPKPAEAKPAAPKPAAPASGGAMTAPGAFSGKSSGGAVKLKWNAVGGATGYNIYMSPEAGSGHSKLNPDPLPAAQFDLGGLPPGVPFFFYVVAVGPDGKEGPKSKEVSVVP